MPLGDEPLDCPHSNLIKQLSESPVYNELPATTNYYESSGRQNILITVFISPRKLKILYET